MRHAIVRAAVFASLICGATVAWSFSTGPPASRTSAFAVANKGAELNCLTAGCHTGSPLNDPSGKLEIFGVPMHYVPNQTYTIRVRLQHSWSPLPTDSLRWGFEMAAVQKSTGDSAGFWILGANTAPDTFKIQKPFAGAYSKRWYISHTRNINHPIYPNGSTHYGEVGPVEWNLQWKAPPGDSGKVFFFAAGNSANGDGVSVGSGDFIFTDVESTAYSSTVDVDPHPSPLDLVDGLDAPFPNPMIKCTNIDFTIAKGGYVNLEVFDVQGRHIRTILRGYRPAGTHGSFWDGRQDDGSFTRNGLYFLRLQSPSLKKALTQRITLAR